MEEDNVRLIAFDSIKRLVKARRDEAFRQKWDYYQVTCDALARNLNDTLVIGPTENNLLKLFIAFLMVHPVDPLLLPTVKNYKEKEKTGTLTNFKNSSISRFMLYGYAFSSSNVTHLIFNEYYSLTGKSIYDAVISELS